MIVLPSPVKRICLGKVTIIIIVGVCTFKSLLYLLYMVVSNLQ